MQSISQLCYPNSFTLSSLPFINPFHHRFHAVQLPSHNAHVHLHSYIKQRHFPPQAATEEIVKTSTGDIGFIEVGYVSNVHGLQGEIRVKSDTDFPELRFLEPGRRWIKRKVTGRDVVHEVELVEGRGQPGQKSWILKFKGIDTVEQAKLLVGSVMLVREEDRPDLEEGEFYTRDLIGMKLILKENGEPVGTVVNVFDSGANDLLQVRLFSPPRTSSINGDLKSSDKVVSNPLVWVPFVEAIVPHVDVERREMQITPPKGLLELNIRIDERSKKERRQIEWKERKKFQKHLIAAKKKLCELKQEHVFHGLRFGEKPQRSLLSNQIVDVNSKLLQQALKNLEIPSKRWNKTEMTSAMNSNLLRNTIKISKECMTSGEEAKLGANFKYIEKGISLTSKGKVGIVLVMNDCDDLTREFGLSFVDNKIDNSSLQKDQAVVKEEYRASIPLAIVSPAHKIQSLELQFSDNDYFGFDSEKVWILEEEKLPVVNSSIEEQNKHKMLMKTQWEILQSPVGSGGVFSLLSSHNILEKFSEMSVEYVKICCSGYNYVGSSSPLLGLVNDCQADVGVQLSKDEESEENFYMEFSMNIMQKLTKQIDKLQFYAIPKLNPHVVMVDNEWCDVNPSSANSYELRSSIYSILNACSLDKVCVLEITD